MPKKPNKRRRAHGKGSVGKKKKVTVYYPVVIQKPYEEPVEEMCEAEIEYREKILISKIERLAAKGLNNNEIIETLKIGRNQFYERLKENEYFRYSLYKHRDVAVHEVENAIFKRAVGFYYREEQGTPTGMILEVKKYQPPETAAGKFFLTNRRPKEWKNRVETTIEPGEGMGQITFSLKRREE